MRAFATILIFCASFALAPLGARAQSMSEACPRPAVGATVAEPPVLYSQNGVLKVSLTFRESIEPNGTVRYCYLNSDGTQAPTVRVKPGDLVIWNLKNESVQTASAASESSAHAMPGKCAGGGAMIASATNLHFHGLSIPAACHQDDVLHTSVLPSDLPFEYRFRIPANQPPGLYWYHPHIHGFSKVQVLGGASGALIVEGIERANTSIAGLPERVLIIRDQDLLNPNAQPVDSAAAGTQVILDKDGDARNTGDGTGKPAKDLSLNFVPVPFPDYPPAILPIKPRERQLWRVLNASAITYLNLQIVANSTPQWMAVVGIDGVPVNYNGRAPHGIAWQTHVGLPPGGRVEFVFTAPPDGTATLLTRSVDTGSGGENDPVRPIASIVVSAAAPEPRASLAASPAPLPPPKLPWLGSVTPVRTRKLYFSESLQDPKDPNSLTTFFLTVEGQQPIPFDPHATAPNIFVHQGDVEDWIIENRSLELHDFHIHQLHFLLLERFGAPANEPFLRDTVNVPFWDGKSARFPSVTLRLDFRDPNAIGTFPYHCHLLEHEDGGMMGLIRVEPSGESHSPAVSDSHPQIPEF